MERFISLTIIAFAIQLGMAQDSLSVDRKLRFPAWTYHSYNTDIVGLSIGLVPESISEVKGVSKTYGVRLEVDPISILYFMFYSDYDVAQDFGEFSSVMKSSVGQKSYGINISTGNLDNIDTYGISLTAFVQKSRLNYGLSIAGWSNMVEKSNGIMLGLASNSFISNGISIGLIGADSTISNGIQIAGMVNESKYFNGLQIGGSNEIFNKGYGLQIGIWNKAKNFKGIQLGLWNENDKRALPIINWNFKS